MFILPHFCAPIPNQLSCAALSRLATEKALVCLPEELADIVLRRYAEFVHPQLPVLDINALLTVFGGSNETKGSLLLWKALAAAVFPFFTASELGSAGLISVHSAANTFRRRAEILTELHYEPCQATELQALLLICGRLSIDPTVPHARSALMKRASHAVKLIEPRIQLNALIQRTHHAQEIRLWWSYYLLQATPVKEDISEAIKLQHPSSIIPVTLEDFEIEWLSLSRARGWYKQLSLHQAIFQYLQMVACFCRKAQLCVRLHGIYHILNRQPEENKNLRQIAPTISIDEILPVSPQFWMAVDINAELGQIQKETTHGRAFSLSEEGNGLSCLVHLVDCIPLYQVITLSLFCSEVHVLYAEINHISPRPELQVAQELLSTNIERLSVAIISMLSFVCNHRLPLLADNVNQHTLGNLDILATELEANSYGLSHKPLKYRELGSLLRHIVRKWRGSISSQSDSIPLETDLGLAPYVILEYRMSSKKPFEFKSSTLFASKDSKTQMLEQSTYGSKSDSCSPTSPPSTFN